MRGVDPLAIDEPLTQALRTMAVDGFALGTPSRLHSALEAIVEPCDLPKDAAKLTQVLSASPTVLSDAGVVVRRHKRHGVRLIQLIPVDPVEVPVPPSTPPIPVPSAARALGTSQRERLPARRRTESVQALTAGVRTMGF